MLLNDLFAAFMGFLSGAVAGAALCSFYIALGIFSKMQRLTGLKHSANTIAYVLLAGVLIGSLSEMINIMNGQFWAGSLFGFFGGAFIGVFIISLAEVLNILPQIYKYTPNRAVFTASILVFGVGKVVGSFIELFAREFL